MPSMSGGTTAHKDYSVLTSSLICTTRAAEGEFPEWEWGREQDSFIYMCDLPNFLKNSIYMNTNTLHCHPYYSHHVCVNIYSIGDGESIYLHSLRHHLIFLPIIMSEPGICVFVPDGHTG